MTHQEGWAPPIAFGTVSKICVEFSMKHATLNTRKCLNERPGRETHVTKQVHITEGEREQEENPHRQRVDHLQSGRLLSQKFGIGTQ